MTGFDKNPVQTLSAGRSRYARPHFVMRWHMTMRWCEDKELMGSSCGKKSAIVWCWAFASFSKPQRWRLMSPTLYLSDPQMRTAYGGWARSFDEFLLFI